MLYPSFFPCAVHFQRYLKKHLSHKNGSIINGKLTSRAFQRGVWPCCTIPIKPSATENVWVFFYVQFIAVSLGGCLAPELVDEQGVDALADGPDLLILLDPAANPLQVLVADHPKIFILRSK